MPRSLSLLAAAVALSCAAPVMATTYPLTVTDTAGQTVILKQEPKRIIVQDGRDILALAGRELAAIACAVARKLDLDAPSVVAVGGMLEAGELLLGPLREALAAGGVTDLRRLEADPALGALRIASGEIA